MASVFCNCINPCNCLLTEDGYFANRSADGRRNTVVSGIGTQADPLTIEFQQSEFYRPPSGEQQVYNITVPDEAASGTEGVTQADYSFISIYESPSKVFVMVPQPTFASVSVATFGYYQVVGASASFAANATGERNIAIYGESPVGLTGALVAGNTQQGISTGNTVLTCAGFSAGFLNLDDIFFTVFPEIANTTINWWKIGVWQTSGGNLLIDTLKFWMTTI